MFFICWTPEAQSKYQALRAKAESNLANRQSKKSAKSTKNEGLFKQVNKAINLLSDNPRHTGLNTHEYKSLSNPIDGGKVFESYAQNNTPGAYRVFWCYGPKEKQITILAITPHP
jgi:hypothetical protein